MPKVKRLKKEASSNLDYWNRRWTNGQIEFHWDRTHPMLEKHLSKLTEEKEDQKIFFPLCGKVVDMAWLAKIGHQAIGVEYVKDACEQFFKENNIEFTLAKSGDFDLYKSKDGRIRIYNGDFFNFTKDYEGPVENIWDRGSLVALPEEIRIKYGIHLSSLLAPSFRYLLDSFLYDPTQFKGPPFLLTADEIAKHFGHKAKIEIVDSNGSEEEGWVENVRLLTPLESSSTTTTKAEVKKVEEEEVEAKINTVETSTTINKN